jgi:protein-tyrosine phosphatase
VPVRVEEVARRLLVLARAIGAREEDGEADEGDDRDGDGDHVEDLTDHARQCGKGRDGAPRGYAARPVAVRLLFVCLGNICRSPTAEAVMHDLVRAEGLEDVVAVESAGTGAWHVGEPPDPRAVASAAARGVVVDGVGRQVAAADFARADLVLAMDRANRDALLALAAGRREREKVRLLRSFDPEAVRTGDLDVPDPYYGGGGGFEHVLDVVTAACRGLLAELRADGRA